MSRFLLISPRKTPAAEILHDHPSGLQAGRRPVWAKYLKMSYIGRLGPENVLEQGFLRCYSRALIRSGKELGHGTPQT